MANQPVIPFDRSKPAAPFDLDRFLANFPRRILRLRKHEDLFKQGDLADAAFYILNGRVALLLSSDQGKKAVVAVVDAGDFCGLRCLAEERYVLTAETLTDCQVIRIEKPVIFRILREQPAFSEMLVKYLLVRSIRAEEAVVDQIFNSSEKRLARALLTLVHFRNNGQPMGAIAKINHEILAELVGTTRSRVNFFMNKFRRLGFIDYNGHLKVHNSLLSVLSNGAVPHGDSVGFEGFGGAVPTGDTGQRTSR